jgi:DNA (cytosine-5)-methyltransferase 1
MNALDLFSGIGGISLGLERAGLRTVAFCELDPFCRAVLKKHWPDVPCHEDITTFYTDGYDVDVICAGFPCQDVSLGNAVWGERTGTAGMRTGLYRFVIGAVRLVRPRFAVLENVANLLDRGLGDVLGDLAEIGYDAEWHCVRACDSGAPHERDRIWIIAYPGGSRTQRLVESADFGRAGAWRWRGEKDLQAIADAPFQRTDRWPQPLLRGVDDGLHGRLDRLGAIGNAVVPAFAEAIGKAIMRRA